MAETLRDFLIGYGFAIDESSRRTAEAAVRKSEADMTQLTDAEASRREKIRKRESESHERAERDQVKKSAERRKSAVKDYEQALLRFTGISTAIGAVASLTAGGIFASVQKVAAGLEQLNYAGQRSGSTPKAFSSFAYGIAQLGGSLEGAQASLESFGDKLQFNPQGYEQVLRRLGVTTRTAAGQMRDSADLASDALQALGKLPNYEARNYAETLGIDDSTRRAGGDPRLRGVIDQRRSEQAKIGLDLNKASQDATDFEQSRRHLTAVLGDVATKIESILIEKLRPQLDKLANWTTEHGAAITNTAQKLADALGEVATAFAHSGIFQASVRGITHGLETFSKYVSSDDFSKDAKAFAENVGRIARAIVDGLRLLGIIPGSAQAATSSSAPTLAENANLTDAFSRGRGMHWGEGGHFDRAQGLLRRWTGRGGDFNPSDTGAGWEKSGATKGEVVDYIRQTAARLHINPDVAVRIAEKEGLNAYIGDQGTSRGPFQLHVKNNIPGLSLGGLGDDALKAGIDIYDPKTWKRQVDFALQNAAKGGWGPWHGRFRAGVGLMEGIGNYYGPIPEPKYRPKIDLPDPAIGSGPAPTVAEKVARQPRLPPRAVAWGRDSKNNLVPIDAHGNALTSQGNLTTMHAPLGVSPLLQSSIDNSRTRGDTNITHNPTYNINNARDTGTALQQAKMSAGRGIQDLLRDIQGSGQ